MSENPREPIRILEPLFRLRSKLEKALSLFIAFLLACMSVIVFTNVVFRYFLGMGIFWYEEMSRFMFIWIVFLGAVIAYIRGDHLSLDVILTFMAPKVRGTVELAADCFVIFALVVMVQGAWAMAMDSLASGWIAATVPIPYGYVYMVGPVSGVLLLFEALIKTVQDIDAFAKTLKGEA